MVVLLFSLLSEKFGKQTIHKVNAYKFLVVMRVGETPVHIPNTKVKTYAADDTALETVWESRWLPD